jgi:hypothetical protein
VVVADMNRSQSTVCNNPKRDLRLFTGSNYGVKPEVSGIKLIPSLKSPELSQCLVFLGFLYPDLGYGIWCLTICT